MESPIPIFKKTGLIAVSLLMLGMAALYFWFDPSRVSFFPPCPFRLLTGLECPGCGSQRCLHQLMHGHVERAYQYNPLMILSLPYILVGLALEYTPLKKTQSDFHRRFYGKIASRIIFGIVVLYWIGRNVW